MTAWLAVEPVQRLVALGVAGALSLAALWLWIFNLVHDWQDRKRLRDIMVFVDHDVAPAFCTDKQGGIIIQNKAAAKRFAAGKGDPLSRVLEPLFANPDAVVHRLRMSVSQENAAREDIVTRRGHVRVSVSKIPGGELWRIEDMVDRPQRTGDGLALPMLTTSASGTILFMNETLRQSLGRRAKRLADIFDDLPLRNGGIHQLRTRDTNIAVRVATSRAVSDRKEIFILPVEEGAEAALPGGVDAMLDALPIALLQIDRNGIVTSLNRAALKLLPGGADGPVPLASLVEGLGRSVGEWVAEGIEGRGLYRPEVVQVSGAGEAYLQITLGRPLTESKEGLIAVLNDATELKSIEAQFVQSQKMQAIGQLAGGVAHDFNNLLTAISGHCDLLLLRRNEDDPDYADLNQIHQNANRAAALVGQLLAFSRKQTLKMEELDLRDTLGEMSHLLNRLLGERVRLVVAHDPALIPIRGDRRQLEQVLMNLVVNARDAMPDGGEVRIETLCHYLEAGLSRDQVTIPPGQYVIVRVADQGSGIDPSKIGRIFEPFFSTKRPGEGTGLGLSMAYGIVKQSGGYIFADSEPGKGATFSLYFPAGRTAKKAEISVKDRDAETLSPKLSVPEWVETVLDLDVPTVPAEPPQPDLAADDADSDQSVALHGSPADPEASAGQDMSDEGSAGEPADTVEGSEEEQDAPTDGPVDIETAEDTDDREDAGTDSTDAEIANIMADVTESDEPEEECATAEDAQQVSGAESVDKELSQSQMTNPAGQDDDILAESRGETSDDNPPEVEPLEEPLEEPVEIIARVRDVSDAKHVPSLFALDGADAGVGEIDPEEMGAAGKAQTVLLVEDEAPVRAFASRALRLKGYTVVEAACAEDALNTLGDGNLHVDLFVTDVMMPGLDGPSWVREALKQRPEVKTIFVSGYTQNSMNETSAPVPNSYFLPKPFSLADLTRTVQRALQ